MSWNEQEDARLAKRFANGSKITQLAKLHSRTYRAIKERLIYIWNDTEIK
jgi:hypothetical protein